MDNQVHNSIVSFIWGIADDCLRDVYVRGKYRDVILPMTVIRRLDALLEDSKEAVLEISFLLRRQLIDLGIRHQRALDLLRQLPCLPPIRYCSSGWR